MSGTIDQARAILAEALEIDRSVVDENSSMGTLEAWDSLAHVRLILAIESVIGRALEPEMMVEIEHVNDVAKVLDHHSHRTPA